MKLKLRRVSPTEWLTVFAVLALALSLFARVLYRGSYYYGEDILGPMHGLKMATTESFWNFLTDAFPRTRHYSYWGTINSALYTMIPGYLSLVFPWEYWAHLLTFLFCTLAVVIVGKTLGYTWKNSWPVLLAFGASAPLLTFSLSGFPRAAILLPHALVLVTVLSPSLSGAGSKRGVTARSLILTALLCLLTIELTWHLYELSRLVFVVWILAALLMKGIPWKTRAVWVGAGALEFFLLQNCPSARSHFLSQLLKASPADILAAHLTPLKMIFLKGQLTLPTLFGLGVVSLFFLRTNRWFWVAMFLAQYELASIAALGKDDLVSRRYLLMEFYTIVPILVWARELFGGKKISWSSRQRWVAGAMVVAAVVQIGAMLYHFRIPAVQNRHPLPYSAGDLDMSSNGELIDWSYKLGDVVRAGDKIIALYNFSSRGEVASDPQAILERQYIRLGHETFERSFFLFGTAPCRDNCFNFRAPGTLPELLAKIAAGSEGPFQSFTVHWHRHNPAPDLSMAMEMLSSRFVLGPEQTLGENGRYVRLIALK